MFICVMEPLARLGIQYKELKALTLPARSPRTLDRIQYKELKVCLQVGQVNISCKKHYESNTKNWKYGSLQ